MFSALRFLYMFEKPAIFKPRFFTSKQPTPPGGQLPVPPKRPLTAYMLFCQKSREDVLKESPNMSATQQTKILAEKWNKLSPTLKKPFEDLARQNTITYGEAHRKFYEGLSEEQRVELAMFQEKKKEIKKKLKLKRALEGSGIPKPPSSAYTLFLKIKAKEKGSISSLTEFSKEVSALWRNMPDSEKKIYEERARAEKENYTFEMSIWRENLAFQGNEKLLKEFDSSKLRGRK